MQKLSGPTDSRVESRCSDAVPELALSNFNLDRTIGTGSSWL